MSRFSRLPSLKTAITVRPQRLVSKIPAVASTLSRAIYTASTPTKSAPLDAQLDYRKFLDFLREDNDLIDIDIEVDPHLEVGAIIRRVSELNDKAPLFNNVKGAKQGLWRIAGNAASLSSDDTRKYGRIARSFGLAPSASWREICAKWQEAKQKPPLKPNVLKTGLCKQNKIACHEIDLNAIPVPFLHQGDGGKYIQTYGVHVLQTPDKSWTNWSIFRGMVHDKNHLVCLVGAGQHNSIIRDKYLALGKTEIPWALALGVPPAAAVAAAMPVPEGVSEAEFVGSLVGKPLDLVKCETNDLLVPANSEIVLEGTFSLTDKAMEGPFEDYLGVTFEGEQRPHPLFEVKTITYRDGAILPVSCPGRITDESHTTAALASAEVLDLCQQNGLPINDACCSLQTHATWCALQVDTVRLAEMRTTSTEFCRTLGDLLFANKSCMLVNRILLVGDDIDVQDWDEVIWALVTRCRPGKDEYIREDVPGLPITPYMAHGLHDPVRGGKVISDCLFPMEYEGKKTFRAVNFEHSYPPYIKQKVLDNWTRMGFIKSL